MLQLCLLGCSERGPTKTVDAASAPTPPTLRLLVLTDLAGVLEPCGCSRLSRGGIDRLTSAITAARREVPESLLLISGATLFDPELWHDSAQLPQQELWEAEALLDLLADLAPSALRLGASDLALAAEHATPLLKRARSPLLVGSHAEQLPNLNTQRKFKIGQLELRLEGAARTTSNDQDLAQSALRILLTSAHEDGTATDLASADADLVIAGNAARENARGASALQNGVLLDAGRHGEQLLIADIWWSGRGRRWRLERPARGTWRDHNWLDARLVAIDDHIPRTATVTRRLRDIAKKINEYNASAARQKTSAAIKTPSPFAGSSPCAACHTAAYLWWRSSRHGSAYETLRQRNKEYNLDCIGCHVTGHAQPGGATLSHLEDLTAVGCESCHAAALAHVNDPRHAQRPVRSPSAVTCRGCHDTEHSPDFDFAAYRERLRAQGHAPN